MRIAALALVLVLAAPAVFAAVADIQPGYRALSLSVPSHQLRFLSVGDRIDVMATFEALLPDKKVETVVATILQNVTVLDLDPAQGVIMLSLNPNEAQYAALFDSKEKLWLSKRGKGDVDMRPMEMASERKLFR